VLRPGQFDGEPAGIYPLGTQPEAVLMACPTCGTEARKQWMAKHSGLEPSEQSLRLHHWKHRDLGSAPPVFVDQRRYALSCIEQALEMRSGFYTFWGDFGSGKTMALQIVVNEARELRCIDGFYAPFVVILDHLRQLWSAHLDSSAFWERLLTVPVLAIDEVTRFDEGKGWQREKLFSLVDTRYRRRDSHLTLFGTNADPHQNLSPDEDIGYLFSRMREGMLVELRGDVRQALGGTR
jgi:DNA replication protein DnaC